jgi:hypothetical protein
LVVVGKVGGWRDEAGFEGGFVGDQSGPGLGWCVLALTVGQGDGTGGSSVGETEDGAGIGEREIERWKKW